MTFDEILAKPEYEFLKKHPDLGNNIILLTYGGSYAYGTNREGSDIDLRGIATRSRSQILTGEDWEQVVERETDTTVYSLDKYINLATDNNPNAIELLSDPPYGHAILSPIGKLLVDNRHMFLSQQVERTFGRYADGQLRRLMNKAARKLPQAELEEHILKSMQTQEKLSNARYASKEDEFIRLYLDDAETEGLEREIFIDTNLRHLPLRKWPSMINDFANIVTSYDKLGARNKKAIEHNKINKHMMHLIRLYLMAIDILEKEEIITYRANDLDLLFSILNGEYLDENSQPTPEFTELVNKMSEKMLYAAKNTSLPVYPDEKRIKELKETINAMVVDKK